MITKILGSFTISATATGGIIPIPKVTEGWLNVYPEYETDWSHYDGIELIFHGTNSAAVELLKAVDSGLQKVKDETGADTATTGGILIPTSTPVKHGIFKLNEECPHILYAAAPTDVRVSVMLHRGKGGT